MAVDRWPYQEGVIMKGLVCGYATAGSAIVEGDFVRCGTSANEQVVVIPAAADESGWGYAVKAAGTGDMLPVVVTGIVKVSVNDILAIGSLVTTESATDCAAIGASNGLKINGSTQIILGTLLQATAAAGDEVLMILGLDR
jgi:uncharacterized membrane protein